MNVERPPSPDDAAGRGPHICDICASNKDVERRRSTLTTRLSRLFARHPRASGAPLLGLDTAGTRRGGSTRGEPSALAEGGRAGERTSRPPCRGVSARHLRALLWRSSSVCSRWRMRGPRLAAPRPRAEARALVAGSPMGCFESKPSKEPAGNKYKYGNQKEVGGWRLRARRALPAASRGTQEVGVPALAGWGSGGLALRRGACRPEAEEEQAGSAHVRPGGALRAHQVPGQGRHGRDVAGASRGAALPAAAACTCYI